MLDADIRRALLQRLAAHPLIIEEMGVCGQVRCDVVALGEEMVGYEIKSDADTLRRLPRQVEWYSRVLDRAHVVTTERHLEGVRRFVPEWWGVMVASGPADDVRLQPLREAGANPSLPSSASSGASRSGRRVGADLLCNADWHRPRCCSRWSRPRRPRSPRGPAPP